MEVGDFQEIRFDEGESESESETARAKSSGTGRGPLVAGEASCQRG